MKTLQVKNFVWFYILSFSLVCVSISKAQKRTSKYTGKVYQDSLYKGNPQIIPGKLQCEYYDFGGEGVSFHDLDSTNSGSGRLAPMASCSMRVPPNVRSLSMSTAIACCMNYRNVRILPPRFRHQAAK